MDKEAEKILAKHGCLYMKDDYKALFEELEAYYKPTEAVKNNAVLPFVSGSALTDSLGFEVIVSENMTTAQWNEAIKHHANWIKDAADEAANELEQHYR